MAQPKDENEFETWPCEEEPQWIRAPGTRSVADAPNPTGCLLGIPMPKGFSNTVTVTFFYFLIDSNDLWMLPVNFQNNDRQFLTM